MVLLTRGSTNIATGGHSTVGLFPQYHVLGPAHAVFEKLLQLTDVDSEDEVEPWVKGKQ